MGNNNSGLKDKLNGYIPTGDPMKDMLNYKKNQYQTKHPDKKKFKDTGFGKFIWSVGDEAKGVLHTTENFVDNLGKGAKGVGEAAGGSLKILSNPYILLGIGAIFVYRVIS